MKNILKIAFLTLAIAVFTSCNDPRDKVYNEETVLDDLQRIIACDKVSKQDLENLAYYEMAAGFNNIVLEGKTYRQLIEEANKFNDPRDKVYNEETVVDDLQTIIARDKVSKQDLENLAYYLMAANFNNISLEGKTYRQLIEEANDFTEE